MLPKSHEPMEVAPMIYKQPAIEDYVELSRAEDFFPPHTATPTEAWPGTMAKLAVMQARYRNGQELHHSADASWIIPASHQGSA